MSPNRVFCLGFFFEARSGLIDGQLIGHRLRWGAAQINDYRLTKARLPELRRRAHPADRCELRHRRRPHQTTL